MNVFDCLVGFLGDIVRSQWDVFLCHAFADKKPIANALFNALKREGLAVWYDGAEIKLGDDIAQKMQEGITKSQNIIVLATPEFLKNTKGYRFAELGAAYARKSSSGKAMIIPLTYKLPFDTLQEKQPFLSALHSEALSGPKKVDDIAKKIAEKISQTVSVKICVREDITRYVGSVEDRIKSAKREINISGIDCKYIIENLSRHVERALNRNVRFKFILAAPTEANAEAAFRIDRFKNGQEFRDSVNSAEKMLRSYGGGDSIMLRYLPIFPPIGLFITDPGSADSVVKAELYTAKEYGELDSRPHLIIDRNNEAWREYFVIQWRNFWEMSTPVKL